MAMTPHGPNRRPSAADRQRRPVPWEAATPMQLGILWMARLGSLKVYWGDGIPTEPPLAFQSPRADALTRFPPAKRRVRVPSPDAFPCSSPGPTLHRPWETEYRHGVEWLLSSLPHSRVAELHSPLSSLRHLSSLPLQSAIRSPQYASFTSCPLPQKTGQ
jgi:hypothetical protein